MNYVQIHIVLWKCTYVYKYGLKFFKAKIHIMTSYRQLAKFLFYQRDPSTATPIEEAYRPQGGVYIYIYIVYIYIYIHFMGISLTAYELFSQPDLYTYSYIALYIYMCIYVCVCILKFSFYTVYDYHFPQR